MSREGCEFQACVNANAFPPPPPPPPSLPLLPPVWWVFQSLLKRSSKLKSAEQPTLIMFPADAWSTMSRNVSRPCLFKRLISSACARVKQGKYQVHRSKKHHLAGCVCVCMGTCVCVCVYLGRGERLKPTCSIKISHHWESTLLERREQHLVELNAQRSCCITRYKTCRSSQPVTCVHQHGGQKKKTSHRTDTHAYTCTCACTKAHRHRQSHISTHRHTTTHRHTECTRLHVNRTFIGWP